MRFTHLIAAIAAFVAFVALASPVQAQGPILGDWHGVVETPIGPMTLIVTITDDSDGSLRGVLESPDQGESRTPLSSISVVDGRLTFAIAQAQISYEGRWIASEAQWSGTLTQGTKVPLTLRRGVPPARPVVEGLDGVWRGSVRRNGVDLRLVLHVATGARGTIVSLDSPDVGVFGAPVAEFSRHAQNVGFRVPASGAQFTGTLLPDAAEMKGTWTLPSQPDTQVVFVRARAATDEWRRPQTPTPPFPYRIEDVTFDNPAAPGVTLAGTLTLPEGSGPFPAAVLITGSGPQDRDESLAGHKPFAVLADHLTRHGVAVLRYDDRGVGGSTGDFTAATSADFATDARAAVRLLRTRPEIAPGAIGLIGHSEGGIVAPLAAASDNTVRFIVLLAAPGTDMTQLARSQQQLLGSSQGISADELARMVPVTDAVFAAVAASADVEDARARVRSLLTPDALATLKAPESRREILVQQLANEWFRYFLQYAPATTLSRVDVPVLALNGSLDRQVPADENLAAIEAALAHNRDATVLKLDGLNHLFQTARTGAIGEYEDIAETVSPIVLDVLTEWMTSRFQRTAR